jgi:ketosteroid isomerase-like protein
MFARSLMLAAVVIAAVGAAACLQTTTSAANTDADRAKLEADAVSWFGYYAKADADGMANLYAEDALLMPPSAPAATGRAAIKAFLGDDAAKTKAANLSIRND